jgi:protein-S-isoprenylcysteine O-methyltransferase Ste14
MTSPETASPSGSLLVRAIIAFVALPGIVAFALPLAIVHFTAHSSGFARAGFLELAIGVAILLSCVRAFYISGRSTLAPWSPPVTLVRDGLYKWSRNPMYIGVLLIIAGLALGFRSQVLWIYVAALAVAVHLRVVFGEEPFLARTYGDVWTDYKKRVPRWVF